MYRKKSYDYTIRKTAFKKDIVYSACFYEIPTNTALVLKKTGDFAPAFVNVSFSFRPVALPAFGSRLAHGGHEEDEAECERAERGPVGCRIHAVIFEEKRYE